jgi:hypothetical protein
MVSVGMESKERGEGHGPLALDFMPPKLEKAYSSVQNVLSSS